MTTHYLQLSTEPFNAIVDGAKSIESRLYDAKRQLINLSDELVFTKREDSTLSVKVKVIGLLRYETFHSLFSHNEVSKFGGKTVSELDSQVGHFYNLEDQAKSGVVGIEFVLLK